MPGTEARCEGPVSLHRAERFYAGGGCPPRTPSVLTRARTHTYTRSLLLFPPLFHLTSESTRISNARALLLLPRALTLQGHAPLSSFERRHEKLRSGGSHFVVAALPAPPGCGECFRENRRTHAHAHTHPVGWRQRGRRLKEKMTATLASQIGGHARNGAPRPERTNRKLGRKSPILSLKLGGL